MCAKHPPSIRSYAQALENPRPSSAGANLFDVISRVRIRLTCAVKQKGKSSSTKIGWPFDHPMETIAHIIIPVTTKASTAEPNPAEANRTTPSRTLCLLLSTNTVTLQELLCLNRYSKASC